MHRIKIQQIGRMLFPNPNDPRYGQLLQMYASHENTLLDAFTTWYTQFLLTRMTKNANVVDVMATYRLLDLKDLEVVVRNKFEDIDDD